MSEEVTIPGVGQTQRKTLAVVGSIGAGYVAWRWWSARRSASAAGATPLPVDTANTAGAQGDTGFTNPAPGGASGSYNGAGAGLSTNAAWSAAVESDLANLGFDGQAVATALGMYLSSQPLTLEQQNIVRTAWAFEGKPPQSSNLVIIPAQSPPNSSPPPPAAAGAGEPDEQPPAPAPTPWTSPNYTPPPLDTHPSHVAGQRADPQPPAPDGGGGVAMPGYYGGDLRNPPVFWDGGQWIYT